MKQFKIITVFVFFLIMALPHLNYAATGSGNPRDSNFQLVPCGGIDCDFNSLMELANRAITFILYISIPLAAISFSYAGYLYISAGGDTGKIEAAHDIFIKVFWGFVFVLAGWLIVYSITSVLLSDDFKNSESNLLKRSGGESVDVGNTNYNGGGNYSGNIGDNNKNVTDMKDLQFDFGGL